MAEYDEDEGSGKVKVTYFGLTRELHQRLLMVHARGYARRAERVSVRQTLWECVDFGLHEMERELDNDDTREAERARYLAGTKSSARDGIGAGTRQPGCASGLPDDVLYDGMGAGQDQPGTK